MIKKMMILTLMILTLGACGNKEEKTANIEETVVETTLSEDVEVEEIITETTTQIDEEIEATEV